MLEILCFQWYYGDGVVDNVAEVEKVKETVPQNRPVGIKEIAEDLDISEEST